MYIVKVDGRNDVDAWKKPGLKIVMSKKSRPILLLSVLDIAEYRRVSQAAQTNARTTRMA